MTNKFDVNKFKFIKAKSLRKLLGKYGRIILMSFSKSFHIPYCIVHRLIVDGLDGYFGPTSSCLLVASFSPKKFQKLGQIRLSLMKES